MDHTWNYTLGDAKVGQSLQASEPAAQPGARVGEYALMAALDTSDLTRANPETNEKLVAVSAGSITHSKHSQGNFQDAEGPTSFTFDAEGDAMNAAIVRSGVEVRPTSNGTRAPSNNEYWCRVA